LPPAFQEVQGLTLPVSNKMGEGEMGA
jgi:hypothetical protein